MNLHESCSERALACQLTRPVIHPLLFLSHCFSGHTDTRLPPHFQKGVAITSISTGQTALPRALGARRPSQQRRALHASRSSRQHDTGGARGRVYSHEGPGVCLLSGAQLSVSPLRPSPRVTLLVLPMQWECLSCACPTGAFWNHRLSLVSQVLSGRGILPQDESYLASHLIWMTFR